MDKKEAETIANNYKNKTCPICKEYDRHLPDCPNRYK